MKKTLLVCSLFATAFSLATPGMADSPPLPGTLSKVSFSLTVSQVVEGTVAKGANGKPLKRNEEGAGPVYVNEYDLSKRGEKVAEVVEYESKTVLKKYTIKDFLDDMVEVGVIDSIKGWSLVRACGTGLEPVMTEPVGEELAELLGNRVVGQELGFYLVNKAGDFQNVTNHFLFMSMALLRDTTSEKMETPVTEGDAEPELFNYSYSAKFKRIGLLMISATDSEMLGEMFGGFLGGGLGGGVFPTISEYEDIDVNAYVGVGVATGSEKVGTFGPEKTPIFLPGATKVNVSLGANIDLYISAEDQENGEYDEMSYLEGLSLIEGSVSLAAGKPMADVSELPPLPMEEEEQNDF